ncbi:MAG TPA: hypothetical protein EYQ24_11495 [Bacteroidetes bacterium]|nr:hypothetical protein [Bacteroidota bacterium]HIL57943.1 hypothetical protein [Rhodothermales bacterium]
MLRALSVLLVACCLAATAAPAFAQYAEGGARSLAMARSGVAVGGMAWGHANPASWATAPRQVGLESSQAYGLSELRLAGASATVPLGIGTVAASGRVYGAEGYAETRLAVGFGRELPLSTTRRLAVGIVAGYDAVAIDGFGSTGHPLLSFGAQGDLTPRLRAGAVVRNALGLLADAESDLDRPLGTVPAVAVGTAYAPRVGTLLALDVEQDLEGELSVRAGLEARIVDALTLRGGVGTAPVRYSAGVGLHVGPLHADLAAEVHETLGLTPAVSLQFGF